MVSQNMIPSKSYFGGDVPFAFIEQGVAMLSSVLKSKKALQMNITITRTFLKVKRYVLHNNSILKQLKELREKLGEHDTQLNSIYDVMENLLDKETGNAATIPKWEN